jgi:hypothetical protein
MSTKIPYGGETLHNFSLHRLNDTKLDVES